MVLAGWLQCASLCLMTCEGATGYHWAFKVQFLAALL